MTNPDQELLNTIEGIRQQRFPELPTELVAQIVLIEKSLTENRKEAFARISELIDAHLEKAAAKKAEV